MAMLKQTPLFPLYHKYEAKTVDFGGWEMPVQFSGIQKEHHAVRENAGLFDVSHMGEVRVSGSGSLSFLQHLTTNDVSKIAVNQAQYTLMCYPDGGVVDDLLIYRIGEERYMLVINAANIEKDFDWMQKHANEDVRLHNISEETALLALQGPNAERVLQQLTDSPLAELKPFRFNPDVLFGDVNVLVSRTGYTGEDGFELYLPSEDAVAVWEQIIDAGRDAGLLPIGLGARDTLRFEARLPLYGQELSKDITPIEAGLGMFVKIDKGDFIGRDVLAEQKKEGAPRKLVGLEMIERAIPRPHYGVYAEDSKIGEVTTGTQSPTLKKNVGLALIASEYAELGRELEVDIRGQRRKALVVKTPFYKRGVNPS